MTSTEWTRLSFGSICYPSPEYLALLLEVLLSLEGTPFPFVFARDPVTCPLPDELLARVAARPELALLVNWAPQQAILQHPVRLRTSSFHEDLLK